MGERSPQRNAVTPTNKVGLLQLSEAEDVTLGKQTLNSHFPLLGGESLAVSILLLYGTVH